MNDLLVFPLIIVDQIRQPSVPWNLPLVRPPLPSPFVRSNRFRFEGRLCLIRRPYRTLKLPPRLLQFRSEPVPG